MDVKTVSLRAFIIDGDFGGIVADTKLPEVIARFGIPTDELIVDDMTYIIRYGEYEIGFFDEEVMYVQNHGVIDTADCYFNNDSFIVDPWIFAEDGPISKPDIIASLESNDAEYKCEPYHGREVIRMSSGVWFDFDENPSFQQPVCNAISLSFL